MNLQEFGQTIKEKHPAYADMDDELLGKKMLARFPQYGDMVEGLVSEIEGEVREKSFDIGRGFKETGKSLAGVATRIGGNIKQEFQRGTEIAGQAREKFEQGEFIEGAGKTFAAGTAALLSPISGTVAGIAEPGIQDAVSAIQTKWKEKASPSDQAELKRLIKKASEGYENLPSEAKTALQVLGAVFEIGTLGEGSKLVAKTGTEAIETVVPAVKKGIEVAKEGAEISSKNISAKIAEKNMAKVVKEIDKGISKGISPSLTGEKKTITGMQRWEQKARDAVDTIVENKENIKLVDEFGESVEGVPKNLSQFSDSINQTKKKIYNEYSTLSQQAGQTHKMPLNDIAQELNVVANSKVLATEKPEIVKYAMEKIDRYGGQTYSPEQAEDAIKILNQSLDSYYRNPSYDTASKAYIDSLVVNNLRKNLDDMIEQATGAQYQTLKNQYSNLKAIEKDVVHRTLVDARKNNKGLLDFTDIFSGGEAVAGIMTLNPALMAKAATQKGIKEYFKYINNPNTLIKNMFKKAEIKANIKSKQINK